MLRLTSNASFLGAVSNRNYIARIADHTASVQGCARKLKFPACGVTVACTPEYLCNPRSNRERNGNDAFEITLRGAFACRNDCSGWPPIWV